MSHLYALCEIRCSLKGNIMMDLNDVMKNKDATKPGEVTVRSGDDTNKSTDETGKSSEAGKNGNETAKKNGTVAEGAVKGGQSGSNKSETGVRTESAVKNNDIPSTWKILTEKTRRWLALPSTLKVIKKYATAKIKNSTQV